MVLKLTSILQGKEEILLRTYAVQLFPVKLPYGREVMRRRQILTVMIYLITEHTDQIFLSVTPVKIWSEQPWLDRKIRSVSGYTKPIMRMKQKQTWETLWYSKKRHVVESQKTGSHRTQHAYSSFEKNNTIYNNQKWSGACFMPEIGKLYESCPKTSVLASKHLYRPLLEYQRWHHINSKEMLQKRAVQGY